MKSLWWVVLQAPKKALMGVVKAYRLLLSPWLGNACRFEPTCSVYALEALEKHGAISGTVLTACRLARCQPWCQGGHDPVPSATIFTRLFAPAVPDNATSSQEKTSL
jgi:uncharacterized protein